MASAPPEDVTVIENALEALRGIDGYVSYLMRPREAVARAYAQWIAWRSASMPMLDEVDAMLKQQQPAHLDAWPHDDFLPIAAAFDRLMADQGWVTKTPSA